MHNIPLFVTSYSEIGQACIAFAWNGKHAEEFADANQDFRRSVVEYCLANSSDPSPLLLAHLFLAEAQWSAEAWGAPHHFAQLGALLLERGQAEALAPFSEGLVSSFDTFGACHAMSLSPELLEKLLTAVNATLAVTVDQSIHKRLTAARDLFAQLAQGTASKGWAMAAPGTTVSSIRVVWPRWYHRLWGRIKGLWGAS